MFTASSCPGSMDRSKSSTGMPPLVSALKEGLPPKVLKDKHNQVAYFTIKSGFVEVIHNAVTVLVEGAVAVEGKS